MKRFRITHNPYLKTTEMEEYFHGDSKPWDKLGGDSAPDLKTLLLKRQTIQAIGYDILKWLDEYRKDKDNKHVIDFVGLEQDYEDFCKIFEVYKQEFLETKLHSIRHDTGLDSPKLLQDKLESSINDILRLYENTPTLQNILRACIGQEQEEINVLVVGMQNSGKSTLINALLGMSLLPTSGDVETATLYSVVKAEKDYIKIIDDETKETVINFESLVSYESNIDGLKDIICEAISTKEFDELKCNVEKMHFVLKKLNDYFKKRQMQGVYKPLKEIEIGLSIFNILNTDFKYSIKDFPGAGAEYLKKEHKLAIRKAIKEVKKAIIVYVLDANTANYENVQSFLEELKSLDEIQTNGLSKQIDFERSIYVLNKADSLSRKVLECESTDKYRQFRNKKTVLCSAEPAMQLRVNGKMDGKHHVLFVHPCSEDESVIDLRQYALLPEPIKERVWEMTRNVLNDEQKNNALERTGIPLIVNLLDEYAANSASIHKVASYYSRLEIMFDELNREEERLKESLKNKEEELRTAEKDVKKRIKESCDDEYNKYCEKIKENDSLKKDLREVMNENYCEIITEIDAQSENKVNKKKLVESIEKCVIDKINKNYKKYNQIAYEKKNNVCKNFSDNLKKRIEESEDKGEIVTEEWEKIEDKFKEFREKTTWKEFKMPKRFSLSGLNGREVFERIFQSKKWYIKKSREAFSGYWSDEIITPFSDHLGEEIIISNKNLKNEVCSVIDTIAPALISLHEKVENAKTAKKDFEHKKIDANNIKDKCKKLVIRGTVDV